ncbi:hypothetical protein ACKWTF_013725 [Chironomus riparius]
MKYLTIASILLVSFDVIRSFPNKLPEPVVPLNCELPDCTILSNRYHGNALFPHPNPEMYYQCVPYDVNNWYPMERYCICGTVFNPKLARCSFWWGEDWEPICDWEMPPSFTPCDEPHKDKWVEFWWN